MNRTLPRPWVFDRHHAVFVVLISAVVVLLAAVSAPAAMDVARFALLAAAVGAARILRRKGVLHFVSAPFLLAVTSLVLYSLLPWGVTLAPDLFANTLSSLPPLAENPYINNTAERFVLFFSAVSLALAVIGAGRIGMPALQPILPGPLLVIAVLVLAMLCMVAWVVSLNWLSTANWLDKQILDAFPAWIAVLLSVAFLDSLARGEIRAAGVLAFTLAACLVLFIFIGMLKTVAFLAVAMAVLLVGAAKSWRRAIAILGAVAIFFGLILGSFHSIRHQRAQMTLFTDQLVSNFADQLVSKLVIRQMETGYCLNKMIDRVATDGSRHASPLYFLGGFVPRLLWKDKPSLSNLGTFAAEFCFNNKAPGQSSAMTLIGEPLVLAGGGGLVVAALFFFLAHALILGGIARAGPAGAVALLALAPWLADFDQFFALYWANALKMFLYMLPVLVAVAVLAKRAPGEPPTSSEPAEVGPR